jgi:hypothetical protein
LLLDRPAEDGAIERGCAFDVGRRQVKIDDFAHDTSVYDGSRK